MIRNIETFHVFQRTHGWRRTSRLARASLRRSTVSYDVTSDSVWIRCSGWSQTLRNWLMWGSSGGEKRAQGQYSGKGLCKKTNSNYSVHVYCGSGWVGPGLTRNFFVGKASQNSHKPVVIFWSSIMCILSVIAKSCWLLWFECSVHVSDGFPKKKDWIGGLVGGVSSIQFFWDFFNFAKPLSHRWRLLYCQWLIFVLLE